MASLESFAMAIGISTRQSRAEIILQWLKEVETYRFLYLLRSTDKLDASPDISAAYELAANGVWCFAKSMYATSSSFFNVALDILMARYGKFAKECSYLQYKFALSLMYKHPLPREGLITGVPLEKDYQPRIERDGTIRIARGDGEFLAQCEESCDVTENDGRSNELVWEMLETALFVEYGVDSMAKVDILSAIGEMRYMRWDTVAAMSYYKRALAILDRLVGPICPRICKLCVCLQATHFLSEAATYCIQGLDMCLLQLLDFWHRLKNQFKCEESTRSDGLDGRGKGEILDARIPLPRMSTIDHFSLPLLEIEVEMVQAIVYKLHVQPARFP